MAVYYWRGAIDSDVNNPLNWSLWYISGSTATPPAAATKPVWGSDVQFVKYTPPAGSTISYPIYGPSGTLSGNSASAGSTSGLRYLKSIKVDENFPKNIGSSGGSGYLNIYADNIYLYHAANSHSNVYLNVASDSPNVPGRLAYIYVSSKASGVNYFIKGYGLLNADATAYPTYSNIYLYNFNGSANAYAPLSNDTFFLDSTSIIDYNMYFYGKGNNIVLDKGFAIQNDKSMYLFAMQSDSNQLLWLRPLGFSGSSGPAEITNTSLKLITQGINNQKPYILVEHGTEFLDLQMQAGHVSFNPGGQNDGCRIWQGTMNSATSKMTIANTADVSILEASGGYNGFAVQSASTSSPVPIYYNGNYSVVMSDSSYYWGNT